MATTTVTTSKQFSLNIKDLIKGLIMAAIAPVFAIILQSINAGILTFDWKIIGAAALVGIMSYLSKNFFTPAQIVIKDAPEAQVAAVKAGEATVRVVPQ